MDSRLFLAGHFFSLAHLPVIGYHQSFVALKRMRCELGGRGIESSIFYPSPRHEMCRLGLDGARLTVRCLNSRDATEGTIEEGKEKTEFPLPLRLSSLSARPHPRGRKKESGGKLWLFSDIKDWPLVCRQAAYADWKIISPNTVYSFQTHYVLCVLYAVGIWEHFYR